MRDRAFLGECLVDMRGIHGRRQGEGQRNDRDQCARYPERQPLAIGRHGLRLARYQARRKQVAPRPIPHPDARPSPFAPLRDGYISSFLLNCTDKPYHGTRSLGLALAGAFTGNRTSRVAKGLLTLLQAKVSRSMRAGRLAWGRGNCA
jgi:hypothetical protein